MPTANLHDDDVLVETGMDSIVLRNDLSDIRGGRTLYVTGFGPAVVTGADTLGAITAGSAYTNGTWAQVPLTGGTGTGATADIIVEGGVVTKVTRRNPGNGYTAADSLSALAANMGGTGSGFAVVVSTVATAEALTVIKGGHIIIHETATGYFKPMPVTLGSYDALPANHTYKGVLKSSILVSKPFAAISNIADYNPLAGPYSIVAIQAAFKTAVPTINFQAD